MDRRGQEIREMGLPNSMAYTTPPIIQESPMKLPLAPLLSTTRTNPLISPRRGTSIFSPSHSSDQPYHNLPPPPPPPQQQIVQREPSPDPDPPPSSTHTTADASDSRSSPPQPIKYRECLKNHAASMGGHVVDGCGEFMPSGDDGTPEALRCAACDCHRNFHRKEVDGEPQQFHPYNNPNPSSAAAAAAQIHGQITYSMPPHHHHRPRPRHKHSSHSVGAGSAPPAVVNFSGGGGAESSSEDLNIFQSGRRHGGATASPRKRFRTKFSQDQKDRMQEFATKIGWRIQKQDEQEVQQFCAEVGVKRQVFKVWMHNNKQAMKRQI
ncbi:zinc-finger homeodomain protein 6-like [Andrographis paniculata]|uniref:zinc-finger homeodomain protein 6-like n=1 Tax=Andrographis paniculata TaxID=175694 RepID=UPI0021E7CA1B|nr:zinc-finger homeodomain protein 6-like [Andrographis paniculata]XP_051140807.1 zinc-finger homeodomain protein 6-like [Andrographis paniculata]XP_051140809.1 zinc-finger homeodomain protein 6-like [Andrographis paniculata]XP_051140810.1 zinc-finger homeodomain protein 6-like [Andrographis paniculata]